jgi:hypothetical protein
MSQEPVAGSYVHGNETSISKKGGKSVDELRGS